MMNYCTACAQPLGLCRCCVRGGQPDVGAAEAPESYPPGAAFAAPRAADPHAVSDLMGSDVMHDYIVPGLESHLLQRARVFRMTRDQEHFVVPHSHRYDFAALVLRGTVFNTIYQEENPEDTRYDQYAVVRYDRERGQPDYSSAHRSRFSRREEVHVAGEWYSMRSTQRHTITFSRGAEVLVLEGEDLGFSQILEPVVNGTHLHTFHRAPWMQRRGGE